MEASRQVLAAERAGNAAAGDGPVGDARGLRARRPARHDAGRPAACSSPSCSTPSPPSTRTARTSSSTPPSSTARSRAPSSTSSSRSSCGSARCGSSAGSASPRSTSRAASSAAGSGPSRSPGASAPAPWPCSPAPRASSTTSSCSASGSSSGGPAGASATSAPTPPSPRSRRRPTSPSPTPSSSPAAAPPASAPTPRRCAGSPSRHPLWLAGRGTTPRVLEEIDCHHLGPDLVGGRGLAHRRRARASADARRRERTEPSAVGPRLRTPIMTVARAGGCAAGPRPSPVPRPQEHRVTLTDRTGTDVTHRGGVAARIEAALRPLLGGPLPVRLRTWDGSEAGPEGAMLVELRTPQALTRLLWHPGELGAAQAYVTGELEVHGDVGDALDLVRDTVAARSLPPLTPARLARLRARPRPARPRHRCPGPAARPRRPRQAVVKGRLHSLARDRASISHHYDLSNEFYEFLLDPHLAYSCAFFADGPDMAAGGRAGRQARPRLPQGRSLRGDALPRRRLRLGVAVPLRGRALRRAGHGGHHRRRAEGLHRRAHPRARARGPGRDPAPRLPRDRRDPPSTPSPPSRWASTSARGTTRPTPRCCTAPCGRAGTRSSSRCRASPGTTPGAGRSSSSSSPRT